VFVPCATITPPPAPAPLPPVAPPLQGYQQLKVMRTGRNVTCFVEFDSVASATACHESQQVGVGVSAGLWGAWRAPQQQAPVWFGS
jgi:hypothetical protein